MNQKQTTFITQTGCILFSSKIFSTFFFFFCLEKYLVLNKEKKVKVKY